MHITYRYLSLYVITKETHEKNGVEVIVDNNGTLWLNKMHIEKKLDHKNLPVIT